MEAGDEFLNNNEPKPGSLTLKAAVEPVYS
jgi:hypothetical protein